MELGQRLVDLRKNRQLSQEELAEKLYVSRQTISKAVADCWLTASLSDLLPS